MSGSKGDGTVDYTYRIIFIVLSVALSLIDFLLCFKAYQNADRRARYLGYSAFGAGMVTLSYLVSILSRSYLMMSIASSVYFVCIDWMLVSLVFFVCQFTRIHHDRVIRSAKTVLRVLTSLDSLILFINIFSEIAIGYVEHPEGRFPRYSYQMKPLYICHLVFTYILVAFILFLLIRKTLATPRLYRTQYILLLAAILLVVAINALFLFQESDSPFTKLDWSIFAYSLGLGIMCWSAFSYRKNYMLKALSMTIFQKISQGIVLFDDAHEMVMYNRRADHMLPNIKFNQHLLETDFLDGCGIQAEAQQEDRYSFRCDVGKSGGLQPLRCDFVRLRDRENREIGHLYVFTDITDNSDFMTGFERGDVFRRHAIKDPERYPRPTAVAMFDLIGLKEINQNYGREIGNQRIRHLAQSIQKHMPAGSGFVRGHEAALIAVCPGYREQEIMEYVNRVLAASAGTVIYSLSELSPGDDARNITSVIDTCSEILGLKKLLTPRSHRSQSLASLIRALQESDSDTESHVVRTQKMGEALGKRIGLNDGQVTKLKLLCLLHDIGKIGIPLEILNKPGRLTEQEWTVLKTHAEKGYQIAMSSDDLKPIAEMILCHHERWDGRGYPKMLEAEGIPLLSRIINVVDSYDAMVNNRSYRKAKTPEEAKEEIRRCSGTQFDPMLAEAFLEMLEENPEIAEGEKIGGTDIRVFEQKENAEELQNTNTVPLLYSRYMLDLDNTIIEADDLFEKITGYAPKEVIGKMSQFDLIPAEDRAFYIIQVNQSFARGDITILKHEILRKDGSRLWVVCHGKRYYDSAEKAFRSEIHIIPCPSVEGDSEWGVSQITG